MQIFDRNITGINGCDVEIGKTKAIITVRKKVHPGMVIRLRSRRYIVDEVVPAGSVPKRSCHDNTVWDEVSYIVSNKDAKTRVTFDSFTDIEG